MHLTIFHTWLHPKHWIKPAAKSQMMQQQKTEKIQNKCDRRHVCCSDMIIMILLWLCACGQRSKVFIQCYHLPASSGFRSRKMYGVSHRQHPQGTVWLSHNQGGMDAGASDTQSLHFLEVEEMEWRVEMLSHFNIWLKWRRKKIRTCARHVWCSSSRAVCCEGRWSCTETLWLTARGRAACQETAVGTGRVKMNWCWIRSNQPLSLSAR